MGIRICEVFSASAKVTAATTDGKKFSATAIALSNQDLAA